MAMNPMQRRARNAGLIGFLCATILGAVVVLFILYRTQTINQELSDLKALQKKVYIASNYVESGAEVTLETFKSTKIQTDLSSDDLISNDTFEFMDDKTGELIEKYDSKGNPIKKTMVAKTNIAPGTIITKDMLEEVDTQTTDDQRLQEYNMIILPTLLKNGNFIDIRLQLPEGEDYIVVSKKQVVYTDATTVWLKLNEDEILSLGNAIVEAYTINGSKLYATSYTEPGRQDAAIPTYPVSQAVLTLINNDPNVLQKAKEGLWERYNSQEQVEQRNNHINTALSDYYSSMKDAVEAGIEAENAIRQAARQEYVESLMGTGEVGTE